MEQRANRRTNQQAQAVETPDVRARELRLTSSARDLRQLNNRNRNLFKEQSEVQYGFIKISGEPVKYRATQSPEVEKLIIEKSLKNPDWGCVRLSRWLQGRKSSGNKEFANEHLFSPPTVQKILNRHELRTRHDRVVRLEEYYYKNNLQPEDGHISLIERTNPCFCDRFAEGSRSGEVILLDLLRSTYVKGLGGRVTPYVAVDAFSAYAVGELYLHDHNAIYAAEVLTEKLFPVYDRAGIAVGRILIGSELINRDVRKAVIAKKLKLRFFDGRSVGACFVGTAVSTLVIAELLRMCMGERRYEVIDGGLRAVEHRTVVANSISTSPFNPGRTRATNFSSIRSAA